MQDKLKMIRSTLATALAEVDGLLAENSSSDPAPEPITLEEVKKALAGLSERKGVQDMQALVAKHAPTAKSAGDIPTDVYANLIADAEAA